MDIYNINDFIGGWFIGNFNPSILKTDQFEIALKNHKKNDVIHPHYQKIMYEYNIVVSGEMIANDETLTSGDIFVYSPGEVCYVKFLTDVSVVCIKMPSLGLDDKVEVNND